MAANFLESAYESLGQVEVSRPPFTQVQKLSQQLFHVLPPQVAELNIEAESFGEEAPSVQVFWIPPGVHEAEDMISVDRLDTRKMIQALEKGWLVALSSDSAKFRQIEQSILKGAKAGAHGKAMVSPDKYLFEAVLYPEGGIQHFAQSWHADNEGTTVPIHAQFTFGGDIAPLQLAEGSLALTNEELKTYTFSDDQIVEVSDGNLVVVRGQTIHRVYPKRAGVRLKYTYLL